MRLLEETKVKILKRQLTDDMPIEAKIAIMEIIKRMKNDKPAKVKRTKAKCRLPKVGGKWKHC